MAGGSFEDDHAMLVERWRSLGLFEPSWFILFMDVLTIFTLLGFSLHLVRRFPLLSGVVGGAAFHQCACMGHECGHRAGVCSVDYMASETVHQWTAWLFMNLGTGCDSGWWMQRHRMHHEYTLVGKPLNRTISDLRQFDGQLHAGDLLPIYAMDPDHLNSLPLLAQELWWLPSLLLVQKMSFWERGWKCSAAFGHVMWRKAGLLMHLGLHSIIAWPLKRRPIAMLRWTVACFFIQGLLAPQFLLNHVPTGPNLTTTKNDMKRQILHTVNYECLWPLEEYAHISHAFQIEHHFVPKLPSEHLSKVVSDVKWLCAKHGLPYQSKPFISLMKDHTIRLWEVSCKLEQAYHFAGVVFNVTTWFLLAYAGSGFYGLAVSSDSREKPRQVLSLGSKDLEA